MSEDQQKAYDWLGHLANEVKGGTYGDGEDFDMEELVIHMDLAILEL